MELMLLLSSALGFAFSLPIGYFFYFNAISEGINDDIERASKLKLDLYGLQERDVLSSDCFLFSLHFHVTMYAIFLFSRLQNQLLPLETRDRETIGSDFAQAMPLSSLHASPADRLLLNRQYLLPLCSLRARHSEAL